jgi:cobalt-precorrin 5A hydrolase
MGVDKAMIVAGIGCRKGAAAEQIIAAVQEALDCYGMDTSALGLLATGEVKRDEPGLTQAAAMLNVPLLILDAGRLKGAAPRCLTSSAASLEASGVPSLSEAAAIVAAGPNGRLLGPRLALDTVTCALGATVWSTIAGGVTDEASQ